MVKIPTPSRRSMLEYTPSATLQDAAVQGQGISALGNMVAKIATEEKKRKDNDAFLAARNQYDSWNLDFDTKAAQRQGGAAVGIVKDFNTEEETTFQTIVSKLPPRAAHALTQYRDSKVSKARKLHALTEYNGGLVVAKNNYDTALALAGTELSQDPEGIADFNQKTQEAIAFGLSSKAILPSQVEAEKLRVQQLAEKQWENWFKLDQTRALANAEAYNISPSKLKFYTEKNAQDTLFERSFQAAVEYKESGLPQSEVLAKIKEDYSEKPEEMAQVKKLYAGLLKEQAALDKAALKEQETAMYDALDEATTTQEYQKIINDLPRKLQADGIKYADFLQSGGTQISDASKLEELHRKIQDKEITTEAEIRPYASWVKASHLKDAREELRKVQKGDRPRIGVSYIKRWYKEYGIKEGMDEYNPSVSYAMDKFRVDPPASNLDADKRMLSIIKELKADGVIPNGGFLGMDKGMTYAEALADNKLAEWVPDLPEEHKAGTNAMLTALKPYMKQLDKYSAQRIYKAYSPVIKRIPPQDLSEIVTGMIERQMTLSPESILKIYSTKK